MDFFPWKDAYSVGIASIDEEHRQLVAILNQLYADMVEKKAKDSLGRVFDKLVAYTGSHFGHEEELFDRHGFPGGAAHKAEHAALVAEVLEYKKKLDSDGWVTPLAVTNFLKTWLTGHITQTDKAYSAFLVGKGVK